MNNDLISRSSLLEKMLGNEYTGGGTIMEQDIIDEPAVDAVPVVYAKWKLNKSGSGTCSNCHKTQKNVWDYDGWQSYCGCCGAKMIGLLAM